MKNNTFLSIRRLVFVLIVLQIGFLLLIGKLFIIQLPDADSVLASRRDWRSGGIDDVKRGKIQDRHGNLLSISQDLISVSADPKTFNRKSNAVEVAKELAPLLDSTPAELIASLQRKRDGRYVEYVWLKKGIEYDKIEAIRGITSRHRGLKIEIEPNRVYPKKTLASQVIGYLNDEGMGEGIEYQYNRYLDRIHTPIAQRRGNATTVSLNQQSSINSLGNSGSNVVLTIDEIIQDIAERELEKGCKEWNASKGTAIVLAVDTSEILAMASCPTYDINDQTNSDEEAKRNLGIWYLFEPGSIFKIIATSAVLNEGIMNPDSTVFCEYGRYRISKRRVIKDVSGNGYLTLTDVLTKSSNIGMIKIVKKLLNEREDLFQIYVENFGFGKQTGVDLPYEQSGNLYALKRWDINSLGSVPFGQGISVTPLQMVNALAAIANGGVLHKPYITKEIRDERGNLIKKMYPTEVRRVIDTATARQMTNILVGVVDSGSGRRAQIEGVSIAGKTGTAQKAEKGKGYAAGKEVMSFMGFLPAYDPKIAIIVTLDEPSGARFSGIMIAPIFKRIAEQTLPYIERIGLFDSKPNKIRNSNSQIVNNSRTTVTGTQILKHKTKYEGSSAKQGDIQDIQIPISDDTLVKNGEGYETPKPSGRN